MAAITQKVKAVESGGYFSKIEAAFRARCDVRTLDRWFVSGVGPPVTLIAGRRFYDKKQFRRWERVRQAKGARR